MLSFDEAARDHLIRWYALGDPCKAVAECRHLTPEAATQLVGIGHDHLLPDDLHGLAVADSRDRIGVSSLRTLRTTPIVCRVVSLAILAV